MEEEKLKSLDNKEVSDALHMLLHCSLKDTEYETQKGQFHIVYNYIQQLEKENEKKTKRLHKQFKLLQKRDKEIEEIKADNNHQWEERCKLTFDFEELGRDFEIIQHEHDRLDKRNNELILENKALKNNLCIECKRNIERVLEE